MSKKIMWHGSYEIISKINDDGVFGGLFGGGPSEALSHGPVLHKLVSHNPLTNYELNYEIEAAWDIALEICNGNEETAEIIMEKGCEIQPEDDEDGFEIAERGWEMQRLRGVLARRLGYDSVEMEDEHGTTWLFLPGCEITQMDSPDE